MRITLAALALGSVSIGVLTAADPTPGKNLFNLQIIAYKGTNCPQGSLSGGGHRIAVKADVTDNPDRLTPTQLVRQNDIMLSPGDFAVLDGNACVDGVAGFQLPTQTIGGTLDDPTFQSYEVFLRLVGKPGTGIDVRTCATLLGDVNTTADDIIRCSTEAVVRTRTSGKGSKPTFENVSRQLLTICLDTDGNGSCDARYALFNGLFEDFFWNWNTTGQAHAQLVFVAVPDGA